MLPQPISGVFSAAALVAKTRSCVREYCECERVCAHAGVCLWSFIFPLPPPVTCHLLITARPVILRASSHLAAFCLARTQPALITHLSISVSSVCVPSLSVVITQLGPVPVSGQSSPSSRWPTCFGVMCGVPGQVSDFRHGTVCPRPACSVCGPWLLWGGPSLCNRGHIGVHPPAHRPWSRVL